MNTKRKMVCVVVFFLLSTIGKAQDIHFSSINANPMFINPATTGFMSQMFRISTIYRNQWSSVSDGYNTFLTSVEYKPFVSYKDRYGIGVGIDFVNDIAGTLSYGERDISASMSFFFALDREKKYYLSLGLKAQRRNYGYDMKNADFSQDENNNEVVLLENLNVFNLSGGLFWQYTPQENTSLQIGFSCFNINQPSLSFFKNTDIILHRRYVLSSSFVFSCNDRLSLRPQAFYQNQYKNNEIILGSDLIVNLSDAVFTTQNISVGMYYRNNDAIIISPKYKYNNFLAGLSYDINLSKLNKVSHTYGGVELWLSYAFSPISSKRINTKIPCPTF